MTNIISQSFRGLVSFCNLTNLRYMPRWIILAIDLIIISLSAAITFKMFAGIGLAFIDFRHSLVIISTFYSVNIIFFWVFRTYSGIIRHSSVVDAVKIFLSSFVTMLVLCIINYSYYYIYAIKLLLTTGLFINFILSFCALFVYRIIIKQAFEIYSSEVRPENLISALIFGSDANAISVAIALKSEKPARFKIVGFVDKEKQNASKRILDLPIYNLRKKIPILMRSVQTQALIIADKGLSKEEKLMIVDDCLEFNYKVYSVPLITDWQDNNEISKKVTSFKIEDFVLS